VREISKHRTIETNEFKKRASAFFGFFAGGDAMDSEWFSDCGPNSDSRVEAGEWVLEDDLHGFAMRPKFARSEMGDVEAVENDASFVGIVEPDYEIRER